MLRVVLEVESPGDVLHRVFPNGKLGGLTIDGALPAALGEPVEVDVRVRSPRRTFTVRGQLAWVRHKGVRALKECFGIDFSEADEASTARLLAFARNELEGEAMRAELRQLVDLPVSLLHQGKRRKEFLADLSAGGAFVRSADPLLPGEAVTLQLRPPLALALLPLSLKGRVAWVRRTGAAPGMGIEFAVDDLGSNARLIRLLGKLPKTR
jgi:Tfp pilus assembly protein PilZ